MEKSRQEILAENLSFAYGRVKDDHLLDPDKRMIKRSVPKFSDQITHFVGEHDFLAFDYPCQVQFPAFPIIYPSLEHAMMCSRFQEDEIKRNIAGLEISEIKQSFRMHKWKEIENWKDSLNEDYLELLIRDKFIRNKQLRGRLAQTSNYSVTFLCEKVDSFWGNYLFNRWSVSPDGTRSGNLIGKLLMKVRDDVINGSDSFTWVRSFFRSSLLPEDRVSTNMKVYREKEGRQEELKEEALRVDRKSVLFMGKVGGCEVRGRHESLSRVHACLLLMTHPPCLPPSEGSLYGVYVLDLGSSNGSYLLHQRGEGEGEGREKVRIEPFVPVPLPEGCGVVLGASSRSYHFSCNFSADRDRKEEIYRRVGERERQGEGREKGEENTVFVSGLSSEVGEAEVRGYFEELCPLTRFSMPRGRGRGGEGEGGEGSRVAFVSFSSFQGCLQALSMDGERVWGERIRVRKYVSKGGGGGGGGGEGGVGGRVDHSREGTDRGEGHRREGGGDEERERKRERAPQENFDRERERRHRERERDGGRSRDREREKERGGGRR